MTMWKDICRAGRATDDNMAYAYCMRDALGYTHIRRDFVMSCQVQ